MFFNRTLRGKINRPKNRSSVARLFQVTGTIDNLAARQHLFLVVQVDGLLWPKVEVRVDGTSWTAEVHEAGTPSDGRFSLSLYLVGRKGHDEITDWLDGGESTGDYPGLRRIEDSTKLHSIRVQLEPSSRRQCST